MVEVIFAYDIVIFDKT